MDFVCLEQRLVIEVDGGHHMEQQEYDTARDEWLLRHEYRVLRFWNSDVLTNLDSVEQAIWAALEDPLPNPPPEGGGE